MTISITAAATGATTATLQFAQMGANGMIDLQISPREDFQFCVCPTVSIPRASPFAITGLNQRQTYWVRARNRLADGTVEDWSNVDAFRTANAAAQDTAPTALMIEPALFVKPERPSVVAAPQIAGFPALNLFRDSPVAWRSTSENNQHYIYFKTARQPIDTIALLNTNLPETAQWRLLGGDTQNAAGTATGDFDTGYQPFRASPNLPGRPGYHGLMSFGVRTSSWYLLVIESGGHLNADVLPANVLHAEHLIFGLNRASKNHSLDKSETSSPLTTVDRRRSGIVDRVRGLPMRKVDFDISMMTEAQFETTYGDLWRHEMEAALVVPNMKSGAFLHDRILYGDVLGGRTVNPITPRYTRTFSILSLV